MSHVRLVIDPRHPEPRKVARAVELLHQGAVAAYPTDTMYALGCAVDAKRAVEQIYRAKRMDEKQRLAFICPDLSSAAQFAYITHFAHRIMKQILPGPYTVVLPATRDVPRLLTDAKRRTVGIRIPDCPITDALVRGLGRPLLTSSAIDPDEGTPCIDAADALAAFGRHLELVVDGGNTPGEASTVIAIEDEQVVILREGLGPVDVLAA